ncbi:ArsR/SmtB family transcription factor [Streptomyces abyssomicinicus]|uniref:ArsR/SmtB family transcription factor n=1 Tax=Streptomyces abyssomicinicus TaxID=574929 RepID=UPI001250BBA3|nr:metalloregulator ArsR/SmtB family transcription factor [Streptomyces abyssomicinicus]
MLTSVDAEVLRLLGDPLRLKIVTLLANESLCTSHLVEETGARQTNLSNHLKVLREAGIVEAEPCGRWTFYRLRAEALASLADELGRLAELARTVGAERRRSC